MIRKMRKMLWCGFCCQHQGCSQPQNPERCTKPFVQHGPQRSSGGLGCPRRRRRRCHDFDPSQVLRQGVRGQTGSVCHQKGTIRRGKCLFPNRYEGVLLESKAKFSEIAESVGLRVLHWREVPHDSSCWAPRLCPENRKSCNLSCLKVSLATEKSTRFD
ncbi:hypothetical protein FN846DRAFT_397804 [Sphaerosporella brunnea]|uniref:Uncharacterized protein n=1 Tax=Sphaerosporella brunnea TaxID=1250544 RepID=A0A5J5F5G7_9PEZI|nr:hypothetical protein FN846DRAFT_397804 [Sphaerosporella brunnea]